MSKAGLRLAVVALRRAHARPSLGSCTGSPVLRRVASERTVVGRGRATGKSLLAQPSLTMRAQALAKPLETPHLLQQVHVLRVDERREPVRLEREWARVDVCVLGEIEDGARVLLLLVTLARLRWCSAQMSRSPWLSTLARCRQHLRRQTGCRPPISMGVWRWSAR